MSGMIWGMVTQTQTGVRELSEYWNPRGIDMVNCGFDLRTY